jgi:mRNA-degrading endonuclease RelE of RelBE toxin-antitoxin system
MKAEVRVTCSFKRQAKPLLKKYASLSKELEQLENDLSENPYLGTEIMEGIYKIRIGIKSKNKGKSGGARIISYHEEEATIVGILEQARENAKHIVYLISIYDKSEIENISDSEIRRLIENMDVY